MSENEKMDKIDSVKSKLPDKVKGQIYLITNTVNDKKYVGQTRTHTLNHGKYRDFGYIKRFDAHISEAIRNVKRNQCTYLNTAIRKHGKDAFTVELLVGGCEPEELDALEAKYIDECESLHTSGKGYNLTKGGQFTARTTEASRKKISETLKERFADIDERLYLAAIHWKTYDERHYNKIKKYNADRIHIVKGIRTDEVVRAHLYREDYYLDFVKITAKQYDLLTSMTRLAFIITRWKSDNECKITICSSIKKSLNITNIEDINLPEDFYPSTVKEIKPRERSDTYKQTNIQDREERFNDMEITSIDIAVRTVKGHQVLTFNIFEYNNPKKHQCTFGGKHGTFEEWCEYALEFMIHLYTNAAVDPNTVNIIGKLQNYINKCGENHPLRKLLTCYEKLWL